MVRLVTHWRPSHWKNQSQACKPETAPGRHHAEEAPQPESGSAARLIPRIAEDPTKTRHGRTRKLADHAAELEPAQAAFPEDVPPKCQRHSRSELRPRPDSRKESGIRGQGGVRLQSTSGSEGLFAVPP